MSEIQEKLTNVYADRIRGWASSANITNIQVAIGEHKLVESLAEELAKNAYEIYWAMECEYVRQDVDYVANEVLNVELTDEEMDTVIDRYMNSDACGDIHADDIIFYINEVKREEA